MKTIQRACELDPKALDINVGDQIEKLDDVISGADGRKYFKKTFITEGMKVLLTKGLARLAGKFSDSIFHLKQAMGARPWTITRILPRPLRWPILIRS